MHQLRCVDRPIRRRPHLAPRSGQGRGRPRCRRRGAAGAAAQQHRRWRSRPRTRSAGCRRAARIDVLDDYAYWVAVKMGYFGDIETTLEPGPIEATAGTKAVDRRSGRRGLPLPRRLLADDRAGQPAHLRLGDGRLRRLRLRLPEGQGPGERQGPGREDGRPRLGRLAGHLQPGDRPGGRRSDARSTTSTPVRSGARRWRRVRPTPPSPGRACARSGRPSVSTSTTSWARTGRSSRPTPSSSAAPTSRTRPWPTSTAATSAAGRRAWSSATTTRWRRRRSPSRRCRR